MIIDDDEEGRIGASCFNVYGKFEHRQLEILRYRESIQFNIPKTIAQSNADSSADCCEGEVSTMNFMKELVPASLHGKERKPQGKCITDGPLHLGSSKSLRFRRPQTLHEPRHRFLQSPMYLLQTVE